MVTIDSLTFDLSDCSLREQRAGRRQWMSSTGTAYLLQFNYGPIDWPFDLTNLAAASDFYRAQCAENGGAMLAMDLVTAAGVEVLCGIFKYRAPVPDSSAKCYVGILWVPFREGRFQINIEAMEYGTSGMREAVVMMFEGDSWPK
ncbi:MAG TPA: hypothetical protein VJ302_34325, partial [Blastocatellia bacterium]|nr:hypothetical protein [Blastocatellia bacterium]